MSLQKRISKLRRENKEVTVIHRSFITFDGHNARETAFNFWAGACLFVIVAFFAFWIGSGIWTNHQKSISPEIVQAEAEKNKEEREQERLKKEQYINACKEAGKSPSDMGDYASHWSCT